MNEAIRFPYKGSGPALTDLVGGHVAVYFGSLPPALALVKEGKVRALAVMSAKRSPIFPDLPTVAEAALPGYEAVLHYGIVAPAGTSQPIIDKLSAALRTAVMSEDLKARLANDGAEPWRRRPKNTGPTSAARRANGRRSSRRRARRRSDAALSPAPEQATPSGSSATKGSARG
jgi:tripartite-type tricarboxylate transporter receptor subunit TctC